MEFREEFYSEIFEWDFSVEESLPLLEERIVFDKETPKDAEDAKTDNKNTNSKSAKRRPEQDASSTSAKRRKCSNGNKSRTSNSSSSSGTSRDRSPNTIDLSVASRPHKISLTPVDRFESVEEYQDYWVSLLFEDLKFKFRGMVEEELRRNSRIYYNITPSTIASQPNRAHFTIHLTSRKPFHESLSRGVWVIVTSEDYLTEFLEKQPNKKHRKRNRGFTEVAIMPRFHFFGVVNNFGDYGRLKLLVDVGLHFKDERYSQLLDFFPVDEPALPPKKKKKKKKGRLKTPKPKPKPKNCGKKLVIIPLEGLQGKLREYEAIKSVDRAPLLDQIMRPHQGEATLIENNWIECPDPLRLQIYSNLNVNQFNAVRYAVQTRGFSLFQGPPGTGKTRTVIDLLNILHILAFNRHYRSQIKATWEQMKGPSKSSKVNDDSENVSKEASSSKKPTKLSEYTFDSMLSDVKKTKNLERSQMNTLIVPKPRILVCAPSNAAVDEIMTRLVDHCFFAGDGESKFMPDMVRIGNSDKIRNYIKHVTSLSARVEEFFSKWTREQIIQRCEEYKTKVLTQEAIVRRCADDLIEFGYHPDDIEPYFEQHPHERARYDHVCRALTEQLNHYYRIYAEWERCRIVRDLGRKGRHSLELSILDEATIVFCTLNGAGGRELQGLQRGFDYCVIDEAAQSTEPDILIPLRHGVRSAILVGDPRQLPPTVFMCGPATRLWERSMFERFMNAGHQVNFLNIQYRMHPSISAFPSQHFYDGKLLNDKSTSSEEYVKPFHTNPKFGPYMFFDTRGKEVRLGASLSNEAEALFVVRLLEEVYREFGEDSLKEVGIITPYREQMQTIKKKIKDSTSLQDVVKKGYIDIATVDFFQGREKDIIIVSCVRASGGGSIGFVSDVRRMNVAITRAKYALWVVGNEQALTKNPDWKAMIDDAKKRNCYTRESRRSQKSNRWANKASRSDKNIPPNSTKTKTPANRSVPPPSNQQLFEQLYDQQRPFNSSHHSNTPLHHLNPNTPHHRTAQLQHLQNASRRTNSAAPTDLQVKHFGSAEEKAELHKYKNLAAVRQPQQHQPQQHQPQPQQHQPQPQQHQPQTQQHQPQPQQHQPQPQQHQPQPQQHQPQPQQHQPQPQQHQPQPQQHQHQPQQHEPQPQQHQPQSQQHQPQPQQHQPQPQPHPSVGQHQPQPHPSAGQHPALPNVSRRPNHSNQFRHAPPPRQWDQKQGVPARPASAPPHSPSPPTPTNSQIHPDDNAKQIIPEFNTTPTLLHLKRQPNSSSSTKSEITSGQFLTTPVTPVTVTPVTPGPGKENDGGSQYNSTPVKPVQDTIILSQHWSPNGGTDDDDLFGDDDDDSFSFTGL